MIHDMTRTLKTTSPIEPGIIPIFRLFAGVMFGLLTLGLCGWSTLPVPSRNLSLLSCLCTGVLLVWLNIRPLARLFGKWYLPIGLTFATLYPTLLQTAADRWFMQGRITDFAQADPSRLYAWFIPPVLLIAAQYSTRTMLLYVFGVALMPLILAIGVGASPELLGIHGTHAAGRAFFYLISGIIVIRLSKAQRGIRAELAEKNAQLIHYAATLERLTVTRERNRLARDLHDTLAHTLSAINVQLKAIDAAWDSDPTAARERLIQTQELSRTGLQEARKALHALRSSTLDEFGLLIALGRLAEQAAQRAGLTLQTQFPARLPELPPETEQAIYRIAEEAINNVVRHACAQTLTIAVKPRPLTVTITDDGIGFDPAQSETNSNAKEGHYGMIGMHERAALIDAHLQIQSRANAGTVVTLQIDGVNS